MQWVHLSVPVQCIYHALPFYTLLCFHRGGALAKSSRSCTHHFRKWILLFPCNTANPKGVKARKAGFPDTSWKTKEERHKNLYFLPQHFCRFPMVALCINYSFWIWFSISHSSYCTYAVSLVKGITATYLLQSECMHVHGKQFEWVKRQRMHIIISSLPYRDGDLRRTSPASGLSGGSWTPMHQASARLKRNIKKYMKLVI